MLAMARASYRVRDEGPDATDRPATRDAVYRVGSH